MVNYRVADLPGLLRILARIEGRGLPGPRQDRRLRVRQVRLGDGPGRQQGRTLAAARWPMTEQSVGRPCCERRQGAREGGLSSYHTIGEFVRADERRLLRKGEPQALGARAFDLLLALLEHRDRVVGKDELMALVWPGVVVEENNLTVQVSALRKLLGAEHRHRAGAGVSVHDAGDRRAARSGLDRTAWRSGGTDRNPAAGRTALDRRAALRGPLRRRRHRLLGRWVGRRRHCPVGARAGFPRHRPLVVVRIPSAQCGPVVDRSPAGRALSRRGQRAPGGHSHAGLHSSGGGRVGARVVVGAHGKRARVRAGPAGDHRTRHHVRAGAGNDAGRDHADPAPAFLQTTSMPGVTITGPWVRWA